MHIFCDFLDDKFLCFMRKIHGEKMGFKLTGHLGDVMNEATQEESEEVRPVEVTFRAGEDLGENAATEEN